MRFIIALQSSFDVPELYMIDALSWGLEASVQVTKNKALNGDSVDLSPSF
jgi:hypothetical protein